MNVSFITLSDDPGTDVGTIALDLLEGQTLDASVIKPKPAPKEFRLFRAGLNSTRKGKFLFDAESATKVLAAQAEHGADLSIDYDHAMVSGGLFDAMDPSERGKAAGWFNLGVKDGELWALNVKWTPKAALAIEQGEWRYVSPAIGFDKESRRILHVTNIAITNIPATDHPDPLRALSQKNTEVQLKFSEALLRALGLGADATEAQVLSAILSMQVDAVALSALKVEVASLKAAQAKAETEKLSAEIEKAIAEGRVIPAQRDLLNQLGAERPEVVRQLLSTSVKQVSMETPAPAAAPTPKPAAAVVLSDFDKHVARLLGLKPEDMIATRQMLSQRESA